jgi:hypothetical protein
MFFEFLVSDPDNKLLHRQEIQVDKDGGFQSARFCASETAAHRLHLKARFKKKQAVVWQLFARKLDLLQAQTTSPEFRPCMDMRSSQSPRQACGRGLGGLGLAARRSPLENRLEKRFTRLRKRGYQKAPGRSGRLSGVGVADFELKLTKGDCYRAIGEAEQGYKMFISVMDPCKDKETKRSSLAQSADVSFCVNRTGTWMVTAQAVQSGGNREGKFKVQLLIK